VNLFVKIDKIQEGCEVKNVHIEKVKTKKDLKKFIMMPWKIYESDPNWVPPLIMDMKEKLNEKKNPFLEHAEMELFLAYRGDEISGRIAAILDKNHNEYHNEKIVFFGLYESRNDAETAKLLLDTVAEWGKERGMENLRGPMNLSMNDECAFLLEGFDSPPAILMPYNPPFYLELMESCGMKKIKDLHAYYMERDHETTKKVNQIVNDIKKKSPVALRPINMKDLLNEVQKIKYIYNKSWAENWGFVPWTDNDMIHMSKKLKIVADPEIVVLAEHEGKPVGFAFALPNLNEAIKKIDGKLFPFGLFKFLIYRKKVKGVRALVFGILKEYRETGVSYLLYSEFEKRMLDRGYQWAETSYQLEDNEAINRFVMSLGGRLYKKYRIYQRSIN
jgi:GNAT superfamily N-acetyltransferase